MTILKNELATAKRKRTKALIQQGQRMANFLFNLSQSTLSDSNPWKTRARDLVDEWDKIKIG